MEDAEVVIIATPGLDPLAFERVQGRPGLVATHSASFLLPWAAQGVLVLDACAACAGACEACAGACEACAACEACEARPETLFLFWGINPALADKVRQQKYEVHEGLHPLAEGFLECTHFGDVNAARAAAGRRPIVWDALSPAVAFSDGACTRNGKPGARASFAALVTGAQFGAAVVRGVVCPAEYAFVDEDAPERGVRATEVFAAPSNNRGELLGVIHALLAFLRGGAVGPVELVSDSAISLNTLLDWLPVRLRKGTERELKNFDLVMLAWRLLELLRGRAASVTLTHTRSHQKPPPATARVRERFVHRGNAMADEHATLALKNENYDVDVLNAPPALRRLLSPAK